jgi:putative aldouronate transport system permease protein
MEMIRNPLIIIPQNVTLENFAFVLRNDSIIFGFTTTILVFIIGVGYNMTLSICTAYALSRPLPGKKVLSYFIVLTVYFSGGLIPYYLLIRDLGLFNSIWAMILPQGISFTYMTIIKRTFEEFPEELSESAKLDGATDIRILWSIILPNSAPILATFVLYYGVDRWNEWWHGMLFIRDPQLQPLQLVLRNIILDAGSALDSASQAGMFVPNLDGVKMASIVITMVPIMLLYPFMQRYFIAGQMSGAIKG